MSLWSKDCYKQMLFAPENAYETSIYAQSFIYIDFLVVFYCFSTVESVRFVNKIHERGMNNGEYAFFYYTLLPSSQILRPWDYITGISASQRVQMRKKYYSFKSVSYK